MTSSSSPLMKSIKPIVGSFYVKRRSGFRLELQHRAVDAIALAGGRRTVGKDVTEMTAALRAVHFRPRHAVGAIDRLFERARMRRMKAGPAGARLELGVVGEKLLPAAGARERAGALLGEQRAAAGPLGRMAAAGSGTAPASGSASTLRLSSVLETACSYGLDSARHVSTRALGLLEHLPPLEPELRFLAGSLDGNRQHRAFAVLAEDGIERLEEEALDTAAAACETVASIDRVPVKSSCWLRRP